jgi:hypothetical protein
LTTTPYGHRTQRRIRPPTLSAPSGSVTLRRSGVTGLGETTTGAAGTAIPPRPTSSTAEHEAQAPRDLVNAIKTLARRGQLAVAEKDGSLEDIEDEPFREACRVVP